MKYYDLPEDLLKEYGPLLLEEIKKLNDMGGEQCTIDEFALVESVNGGYYWTWDLSNDIA